MLPITFNAFGIMKSHCFS